jgi:peptide/nickel transport system permease protein
MRRLLAQPGRFLLGEAIVAIALLLAVTGPWLAPSDPERPTGDVLLAPSLGHPFGTDASGIDVFSVVVAAFRVDVLIALVSVVIALVGGIAFGALAGYSFNGSRLARVASAIVLRLLDVVQTVPVFILALALVGVAGPSVRNVIIAVAFVNLPIFARLTLTAVRGVESREFVAASRAIGLREGTILRRHVLPNSLESTLATASIAVGGAILMTAGLSFLGAGVRRPSPEWGIEISNGADYVITGQWWISVLPGIVLAIVVLGFALAGDAFRETTRRSRGGADVADEPMSPTAPVETRLEPA